MHIAFEDFLIRPYRMADADALYEIIGDPEVMKHMECAYTKEETKQFLAEYALHDHPAVYALEASGSKKLAGHIIFHPYDSLSYEIGWIIHPFFQGRGLAEKCTEALMAEGYRNGIRRFVIECADSNLASQHIAKKLGFIETDHSEDNLSVFMKEI